MNELSLFAGAGGGILGTSMLGIRCLCAVESDPYAMRVLMARQNDGSLPLFPIWDDVRTFDGREWRGLIDIISGGFPCQAFSKASRGRRVAENLWPEMRRVIGVIAPRYIFAENVSKGAIEAAASDLTAMGYKAEALALSAADMGADHVRQRYWLLAHSHDKSELRFAVDDAMAQRQEFRGGFWKAEPDQSGVDDGIPSRLDRYRAIGNAQVPIVAYEALRILAGA